MGIKSSILNNLTEALEDITISNGYSVNIQNIDTVRLASDKLNAQERLTSVSVTLMRESKQVYGEHQSTNDSMMVAIAQFRIEAIMDNNTHTAFLDFLEDIEACLSKDESRNGLVSSYHHVQRTWISDIDMVETEEYNEERIQKATIVLNVQYQYIPLMLSATSIDRQG